MLFAAFLSLLLLSSLPSFQSRAASIFSQLLADRTHTRVSVGALRLSPTGRIVLDNVRLYDRRDTLLLRAARIAAKVDLLPLIEKKIRISGAQLIGARLRFYKDGAEPCNFQFLVDAFSSSDSTSAPLNLGIKALVIRRGEARFDRLDRPQTPGRFNPDHLHVTDLGLTMRILAQMHDTLAVDLRDLTLREASGLAIEKLSLEAKAGRHSASIENLLLRLPESTVEIPRLTSHYELPPGNASDADSSLAGILRSAEGSVAATICPRDLACLLPQLATFAAPLRLSSSFHAEQTMLRLPDLSVADSEGNASLLCSITVPDLLRLPNCHADIRELRTGAALHRFLAQNLPGVAEAALPFLSRLGHTSTSGTASWHDETFRTALRTESEQGTLELDATLHRQWELSADIAATDLRIGHLLDLPDAQKATTLSLTANVAGALPHDGHPAQLAATGHLGSLLYRNYMHRNVRFAANVDGTNYSGELQSESPDGQLQLQVQAERQESRQAFRCTGYVRDLSPYNMNLTKRFEDERIWGNIDIDLKDTDPNHPQGEIRLDGLEIRSHKNGDISLGSISLDSNPTANGQHLQLQSDFINASADGTFHWQTLPASFAFPVRQNLPSLFTQTQRQTQPTGNDFRFSLHLQDTILAERLLGYDLRLPAGSTVEGTVSDALGHIVLQLNIPHLLAAEQELQDISCRMDASATTLQTSLQCERLIKGLPVSINLDAYATADKLTSRLLWDNKRSPATKGNISLTTTFRRGPADTPIVEARVNPSDVVIGDSLWRIRPAAIRYHDKAVDIDQLAISQADRHITIGGRISDIASDTLKAELADIDISYIMDLVNFHKVDFDGHATGSIYATSLLNKPLADAYLLVKDFTFNSANLGNMDLHANWGNQPRAITLEADTRGPMPLHRTQIDGTIIPGRGPDDGINLDIRTSHIDLAFLNKYTKNIFANLHGQASGRARVFGPFKTVNLEGDLLINEMGMHVLALGTDYRMAGDSIIMRPDNIWLRSVRLYDNIGQPGLTEHSAIVDAHLMHDALKHLRFDIDINASNLLAYNFPSQGSMNFHGTAYTDAHVHLGGSPGNVDIDIDATTMPGTSLVYNVASTSTVDDSNFITYTPLADTPQAATPSAQPANEERTTAGAADIRINFNVEANPNATVRLLLDPRSGDNITLQGNGQLRARYYNKGRFQLFGTYRISEGNYRMSIRDLIRKDFSFQPDGTITFGGDAMQAALNLKAIHTVPNVSLDELSNTGIALSNTRVDCIMNITGKAREPAISFDFDIPNANEDERQMVRSLLSSEEERDMQAVYLLGVGRFYTYGTMIDRKQTKGGMAVNSVLSSALTSRFNQVMSQALGGTGWTFGTNLRTGQEGWEHMDVEGQVSGKMFSGRLLFNGNFGYRENKYKPNGTGFIGDFDIQYRLSPGSPFSLKAYNKTNDRYFTQSSLTTQGIGIKFQRDFSRWAELFHKAKNKRKKSK